MLVQKILFTTLLASGLALVSGCHDDFRYGYLTPPVTVTTDDSDSGAHYGKDTVSHSDAHYNRVTVPHSAAYYGSGRPVPPVSVSPNDGN
jgi:hypothetical protein